MVYLVVPVRVLFLLSLYLGLVAAVGDVGMSVDLAARSSEWRTKWLTTDIYQGPGVA